MVIFTDQELFACDAGGQCNALSHDGLFEVVLSAVVPLSPVGEDLPLLLCKILLLFLFF